MWATISSGEWWQMCFWTSGQVSGLILCNNYDLWGFLPGIPCWWWFAKQSLIILELGPAHLIECPRYLSSVHITGHLAPVLSLWNSFSRLGLEIGASPRSSLIFLGCLLYSLPWEREKMLTIPIQHPMVISPWKFPGRKRKSVELSSGLLAQVMSTCGRELGMRTEAYTGQAASPSVQRRGGDCVGLWIC